jgi:hypothetical protein
MADQPDPSSAAADATPMPKLTHEHSIFARKFKITSFEHDPIRWNRDWEKVLRTLSSADVYTAMGEFLSKMSLSEPDAIPQLHQGFKEDVLSQQSAFTGVWDELLGENFDSFSAAWFLLDEKERTRHLLKGLEEASQRLGFGQDSRALCPEITVSAMLKQSGRTFTEFLTNYQAKLKETSAGHPYLVASEWWNKAPQDVPQSLSDTFPPSAFEILTLLRNVFIGALLATPSSHLGLIRYFFS